MATKFIGVKELRQNMAKIIESARKNDDRLILMRKNKPLFELRPFSKNKGLEQFMFDIKDALDDAAAGRLHSHKEMKGLYGVD